MESMDALRIAASRSDTSITSIGASMGKSDSYVSATASRGSVPRCDTMAAMADVCGYRLALVPRGDLPDTALVIDPPR